MRVTSSGAIRVYGCDYEGDPATFRPAHRGVCFWDDHPKKWKDKHRGEVRQKLRDEHEAGRSLLARGREMGRAPDAPAPQNDDRSGRKPNARYERALALLDADELTDNERL